MENKKRHTPDVIATTSAEYVVEPWYAYDRYGEVAYAPVAEDDISLRIIWVKAPLIFCGSWEERQAHVRAAIADRVVIAGEGR